MSHDLPRSKFSDLKIMTYAGNDILKNNNLIDKKNSDLFVIPVIAIIANIWFDE